MKITNKLIEEVVAEVAGEDVVPLVKALYKRKDVSEFKVAEKIGKDVNQVRNMLYRLYHVNLVSFIRRKDKKKGWYIYYWTFKPQGIRGLLKNMREKQLDTLKERLKKETESQFYMCANKCVRLDFEKATEFEFKCPECGEIMNQENNVDKIRQLKKDIARLERELASI
jgi:transcription initiation factor TFIIE subunit alpha